MEDPFILRNEIEQSDVDKFNISEEEYSKRDGKRIKHSFRYNMFQLIIFLLKAFKIWIQLKRKILKLTDFEQFVIVL